MTPPGTLPRRDDAIRAGFIPLLDCAPLLVAEAKGFARAEGLSLVLQRETSWATLRDRIAVRHLDVAHMLAAMPIASNLGLMPLAAPLIAPMSLGTGGNTITVSGELWRSLSEAGAPADLDAAASARAVAAVVESRRAGGKTRLVLAVVHPHSAHRYQLAYWLAAAGLRPDRDVELVVVPPSLMPDALADRQIDGFCAGEPWGSIATARGAGVIVTTNAHIWRSGAEKVLGMRSDWALADTDRLFRLLRAVHRAAEWCDAPDNRRELSRILALPEHLDLAAERLLPSLERRLAAPGGGEVAVDGFLRFYGGAATFPWVSHALWFYAQMVRWGETRLSPDNFEAARRSYRPDLYREAVGVLGVTVPSANAKVEGALAVATPVGSTGRLYLGPDGFFDGTLFDPERISEYIESLPVVAG
jgi:NitT/TauT family transport system ATP-binding protein